MAPAALLKGCVSLLVIPIRLGWIALLIIVNFKTIRRLLATIKIWIRSPSRVTRITPALIPGARRAIRNHAHRPWYEEAPPGNRTGWVVGLLLVPCLWVPLWTSIYRTLWDPFFSQFFINPRSPFSAERQSAP